MTSSLARIAIPALLLLAFSSLLFIPSSAFACDSLNLCPSGQNCNASGVCVTAGGGGLINPLGSGTSLTQFVINVLHIVVRVGSIFIVLMIVYVGFLFVKARGAPGEITKAREALLWTIVGALILLGAEGIARGIQATVTAVSGG